MNMGCETRILLLVEDDPSDSHLVRTFLDEAGGESYRIVHVPRLDQAVEALDADAVDIILLDLGLPDCDGVECVRRLHRAAGDVPIVVLTGNADPALAIKCMDAGAQDYLEKNELRAHSLRRAIGYATARIREAQLREMQQTLANMRELSSSSQSTSVTAMLAGSGAISARNPEAFAAIRDRYFGLLEPYLSSDTQQQRLSREELEVIATALGDANAGPRDLFDVHLSALERATSAADERHAKFLVFETRLLALQMMGLLVEYYRVGHRRLFAEGGRT